MFYFQFETFSSNSGSGRTRQQLKSILFNKKGKLTQENWHWKVKIMWIKNYATTKLIIIGIIIIIVITMIVSYIFKIIEAGNN